MKPLYGYKIKNDIQYVIGPRGVVIMHNTDTIAFRRLEELVKNSYLYN